MFEDSFASVTASLETQLMDLLHEFKVIYMLGVKQKHMQISFVGHFWEKRKSAGVQQIISFWAKCVFQQQSLFLLSTESSNNSLKWLQLLLILFRAGARTRECTDFKHSSRPHLVSTKKRSRPFSTKSKTFSLWTHGHFDLGAGNKKQ